MRPQCSTVLGHPNKVEHFGASGGTLKRNTDIQCESVRHIFSPTGLSALSGYVVTVRVSRDVEIGSSFISSIVGTPRSEASQSNRAGRLG